MKMSISWAGLEWKGTTTDTNTQQIRDTNLSTQQTLNVNAIYSQFQNRKYYFVFQNLKDECTLY